MNDIEESQSGPDSVRGINISMQTKKPKIGARKLLEMIDSTSPEKETNPFFSLEKENEDHAYVLASAVVSLRDEPPYDGWYDQLMSILRFFDEIHGVDLSGYLQGSHFLGADSYEDHRFDHVYNYTHLRELAEKYLES